MARERLHERLKPNGEVSLRTGAVLLELGQRNAVIYLLVSGRLAIYLDHDGNGLSGIYRSPVVPEGTLAGSISGNRVEIRSHGRHEGMDFRYVFTGSATADRMEGSVALGWEDGSAPWVARRV